MRSPVHINHIHSAGEWTTRNDHLTSEKCDGIWDSRSAEMMMAYPVRRSSPLQQGTDSRVTG